jgi:hypothetical protein
MLAKDIFGNWIKCHVYMDYHLVNKRTHSNKYAMPLPKEIFDVIGQTKVFIAFDLWFDYQ